MRVPVAVWQLLYTCYFLTYLLDLNIPADIKRHWRRPRGRPRATWLRAIDTDVQSVNIEIHSAWRKPVTARSGDASSTRQHSAIAFIGHAATEEEKKRYQPIDPVISIRSWPSISFPALSLCPAQHLPLSDWPMTWNSPRDFIRDPTSSTDCLRRILETYLLALY